LRRNVACRAVGRIVKRRQVFSDRARRLLRINIPVPLRARDRAMLVGVGLDEARIDSKAFTTDEAERDAYPDDTLEHTAEYLAVAEALVAGARERRMIGDLVLDAEATEPAIGEIEPDLTAQRAFRAN